MNEEQMSPWLGTHALNSQVLNINDDLRVRRATRLQVERAPWGGTRGDFKKFKLKKKKNLAAIHNRFCIYAIPVHVPAEA